MAVILDNAAASSAVGVQQTQRDLNHKPHWQHNSCKRSASIVCVCMCVCFVYVVYLQCSHAATHTLPASSKRLAEMLEGCVQDIAAKIGDVLRPYSKGSRAGLDTRDRLQRVLKQTQPIASVDLRPLTTQEGPSQNGDTPSEPPVREDPARLMLSPSWQVLTLLNNVDSNGI